MNAPRFWIRKDRETYFLGGVIIACTIGAFVSSYWHYTDRTSVRQKIKLKTQITDDVKQRKLRDLQYTPSKLKIGTTQYYRMDAPVVPAVPLPGEDDE